MQTPRHVIVVHRVPMLIEALEMVLIMQGFTVHTAATYQTAKALLRGAGGVVSALVVHGDMPEQPLPGTLLRLWRASPRSGIGRVVGPQAARARPFARQGRAPAQAVRPSGAHDRSGVRLRPPSSAQGRRVHGGKG